MFKDRKNNPDQILTVQVTRYHESYLLQKLNNVKITFLNHENHALKILEANYILTRVFPTNSKRFHAKNQENYDGK